MKISDGLPFTSPNSLPLWLWSIILALILTLCVGYVSASSTWVGPTANPTGGNTDTPLNVGSSIQNKAGPLTLGSTLGVTGATLLNSNLWIKATGLANGLIVENGNVGIGTTNPGAGLDIQGTGALLRLGGNTDGTSWAVGIKGSVIQRSGNAVFAVDSGNVGIGTTNPTSPLQVNGSSYALPATSGATQSGAFLRLMSNGTTTLDFGYAPSGNAWIQNSTTANLANNAPLLLNPNGGNVGIGMTNPTAKLTIGGTAGVDGIQFPDGSLQTTAYNKMQVFTANGTWKRPSNVNTVLVTMCGGGGGGQSFSSGGNGGGSGTCYRRWIYPVTSDVSITVGTGGATNSDGGSSSFGSLVAAGGTTGGGGSRVCPSTSATSGNAGSGSSNPDLNGIGGTGGSFFGTFTTPNITDCGGGGGGGGFQGSGGHGSGLNTDPSTSGTGYGSGGGGGSTLMPTGSGGTSGIVIVEPI